VYKAMLISKNAPPIALAYKLKKTRSDNQGKPSPSSNTNNALAGNLIGFSGNLALVNRNIGREAIRMTHRLRSGIELNNSNRSAQTSLINSNEIGYSNNIVFPRDIFNNIIRKVTNFATDKKIDSQTIRRRDIYKPGESFINSSISFNNRLGLFNLQTIGINAGVNFPSKNNTANNVSTWTVKPLNIEFNYLYNKSDSFQKIIDRNPFLRYSYNTSFVIGFGAGFSNVYRNPKHLKSLSKERVIRFNGEESGLTWGWLPILNNNKNKFIKLDGEYKYTVVRKKTAYVFRTFAGVGIPLLGDSALPFFKQFLGGGSNSMRGWPIRGIGRGSQPLTDFTQNVFNDRTGDMQLELNGEFRYDIKQIIKNLLTLRGALFVDIGNVWNIRNTKLDGSIDSAQFQLKNLYRDIGLSAGTGFRLDFNYVVLRFDMGFRFKRPELAYENNGWKAPEIGFDDFFKKIFTRGQNDEYRRWRYENFNFTIGISYPF
jgi:outer membrane protein assembly factor BamA